ncbi:MAG: HEAT repeat domain-containing protein, partial [Rhodospirillaceae bacterium]
GTLATAGDMVAASAARALGRIGDAAAEPALIAALDRGAAAVGVAAAEALGRIGSPQAVVPLRSAASSHLLDGDLRRAARQAVAEIQSRVSGASPGQLSLAGDEAGRLSLVEEEQRGRLSMAEAARAGDRLLGEDPR